MYFSSVQKTSQGVRWLSGRASDSESKGPGFDVASSCCVH